MPLKKYRTLPAQKVNPGIRAAYRRALGALVREMGRDAVAKILAEYDRLEWRIVPPDMAQDGKWRSPAEVLKDKSDALLEYWRKRFNDKGTEAAKKALKDVWGRIKLLRKRTLKEAGITVKIDPSRFTREHFQALLLQNENLIVTIPETFFSEMKGTIDRAIVKGLDRAQMAEELHAKFDPPSEKGWSDSKWEKHCRLIARDQTSKAVQALAESTDADLGLTEGIWIHMPGRLESRPTHMAMNGKKFTLTEGLYDSAEGRNVKPAECINCLPGYIKINGFSFIKKLYRHWYSGKLSCLVTDNGAILEVTPNHPVLTPFGWKAASRLNEGDYIVQADPESGHVFKSVEDERVPTIQEMFDALHLVGEASGVFRGSSSQFHGDGTDSEVDVIAIDRLLMNEGDALFFEAASKFGFSRADVIVILEILSGKRPLSFGRHALFSSSCGDMSSFCDRLTKFLCGLTHPERRSLFAAAYMHTRLQEPSADSRTGTPEFFSDGFFCHAGLVKGYNFLIGDRKEHCGAASIASNHPREFFNPFGNSVGTIPYFSGNVLQIPPSGYLFGRIIKKAFRDFSGHVYNLQTRSESFIAQNVIVHNCMCTYRVVVPDTWRA